MLLAAGQVTKTVGHRYLTDKSMILVSLGSMDMRKSIEVVQLERVPHAVAPGRPDGPNRRGGDAYDDGDLADSLADSLADPLADSLALVVSASGADVADGESRTFTLPVAEHTEPIAFYASDLSKIKLMFDLVRPGAGPGAILGRAVALLSTIKPAVGSQRTSLQGDLTVPIVSAADLDAIGSVTFNFLVVTPFTHPNFAVADAQPSFWKSTATTQVIGHRGLGKNFPSTSRKSLQLGENTVQSFIAAANLGASYVEFDVQLTKDHIPVIYHDFLVSETGIDAPVHTLTLEQFLQLNDSHSGRHGGLTPSSAAAAAAGGPAAAAASIFPADHDAMLMSPRALSTRSSINSIRQRSRSVGAVNDQITLEKLEERMKHTRDFKTKGFKGNTRGHHIQAPFATLEELFKKLPDSVGFNIELKYPMLHETELEEMDMYAVELNSFVDTVLAKIYDLGKGRNIILSSFNPDVCILMAFKQPRIPVLFLTDAGTEPVGDIRASSLQEAIRFASRWNLLGVVSNAEPLVLCPRLVRIVKESGLVCVSYGTLNNEPDNVKLQVREGIDAVIADSVLAIRQGLTEHENAISSTSSASSSRGSSVVSEERLDAAPLPASPAVAPRQGQGQAATHQS
ncbi:Glycerophosphocholine phosphodiesterase [Ascosphaera acerosa]|nr:Glycerophosphocholine phosphodiesterase [Ascosphaera acerosa]